MIPETTCLKKSLLALIIATASLSSFAQTSNLKEKKITLSDDSKITYHVKDNNIKEGSYYIKTAKSNQLLLKGAYTDNKRSGNWYFFNEAGKPETVYNFQQNTLAFIDSALLSKLSINIPGQDKEVAENAKIPVLLSPIRLFLSEMSNNITIPAEHFKPNQSLPIQIKSEVDTDGDSKYFISYVYNGKTIQEPIKLKKSAFELQWIPAEYNNIPVKSEVIINTEINNTPGASDGHRRFRWN